MHALPPLNRSSKTSPYLLNKLSAPIRELEQDKMTEGREKKSEAPAATETRLGTPRGSVLGPKPRPFHGSPYPDDPAAEELGEKSRGRR
jgi:hypothetical protein